MKYEEALKLKTGDKVVLEVDSIDPSDTRYTVELGSEFAIRNAFLLGKLEDFQPTEKKIKMTVREKKEFDELKRANNSLFLAFDDIDSEEYPNLFGRLFDGASDEENNKAQLEFARACENPSLIEVVKEKKYRVKILGVYLHFDIENRVYWISDSKIYIGDIQHHFTQLELDKMQTLEQFKGIDLNKCKEEVEDE